MTQQVYRVVWIGCFGGSKGLCKWSGSGVLCQCVCSALYYLRRQEQVAVGVLVGPGGRGVLDLLVVAPAVAVLRPLHLAALRNARAHVEDAELRFGGDGGTGDK